MKFICHEAAKFVDFQVLFVQQSIESSEGLL